MEYLVVYFDDDRGVIVNSAPGAWMTNQILMLEAGTYYIELAPRVRAGFVAAGFDTIERVADPVIPPKTKIVTIAVGPETQEYLQMADPAADALCGAGLTVAYPDGKSYSGDLSTDATVNVQCDQTDAAAVQQGFGAVWQMLQSG